MCEILQNVKNELEVIESESASTIYDDSNNAALVNMPVEILLKICSFLDAHFLKYTLSKVCKRFDNILSDDHLWKSWVHNRIGCMFPPLPDLKHMQEEQIDWVEVCVDMDVEKKKWSNSDNVMNHFIVKDVHFASVDTVLLCNNGQTCISGGRDRVIALWNVEDIKSDRYAENKKFSATKPRHMRHDAHAGWVWDLACDNVMKTTVIYSASWDNTVKAWDLVSGFQTVEAFRCGMSALSVVTTENTVLVGLYSKKILSFELRSGPEEISSYKPHKGPILGLFTYKNYVASISDDKTLAVWDRVAGKLVAHEVRIPTGKAYPVCISWSPTALYIGDSKGCLHLFNPEDYSYIKSHEIWAEPPIIKPSNKITTCCQTPGCMIACSDRGEIKFLYNGFPPKTFATIQSQTFDVTQLRYLNGVLAVGTCDSALEFWIPKNRYPPRLPTPPSSDDEE